MKKVIVGLSMDDIDLSYDEMVALGDQMKYELAMDIKNTSCQVYHSTQTFLDCINMDIVDTENTYWFEVEVKL